MIWSVDSRIMNWSVVFLLALLAFANGANDNSKGVATLVGYGAATPRQALLWAAISTTSGAIFSFWFARGLITSFSTGLFAKEAPLPPTFFIAVLIGALIWVAFATRTGLPVSTTHAITGALTGAGMVSFGAALVQWEFLGTKLLLPMALSPVLSLGIVYVLAWPFVRVVSILAGKCACLSRETSIRSAAMNAVALETTRLRVRLGDAADCDVDNAVAALKGSPSLGAFHWLTSGLVGFARGWNALPVSTTHISPCAILAVALQHDAKAVQWG